jgi:hypothetical protein
MRSRRSCLIGALLVSLPSSALVAQDRPVSTSESDLVVIHATIKYRDGAYVTGLTRDASPFSKTAVRMRPAPRWCYPLAP